MRLRLRAEPGGKQLITEPTQNAETGYDDENRCTGDPEKDLDSWKLVHFTRHLPQLTQEELDEMKTLNPKTPNELLEEAAFDRFLEGADTGGKSVEGHHH